MEIRALKATDERALFRSGQPDIDAFFLRYAGQNQFRHHIGVTYVMLRDNAIAAYVTLSAGDIEPSNLPHDAGTGLPGYFAPVLRIARLGVDERAQREGVGTKMLHASAIIAAEMRARVGCVGMVVDAKPESARFYEVRGFRRLPVTSRAAGAGAPPLRLFSDLRHLGDAAALASRPPGHARVLAAEFRRRARELALTPEQLREAVDALLATDAT
jgi:GNAT superfamily N-acetyltransferase